MFETENEFVWRKDGYDFLRDRLFRTVLFILLPFLISILTLLAIELAYREQYTLVPTHISYFVIEVEETYIVNLPQITVVGFK